MDEVASFMIVVHVMQVLGWRDMYMGNLEKLMHHLEIIEEQLIATHVDIYEHMLEELGDTNLYVIFSSFLLSIFIYDL